MKNLFGFQLQEGQEEGVLDGMPFQSAKVSMQQEQLLEKAAEEIEDLEKKATLHPVLQFIMQIGFYIGGLCFLSFLVDVWKLSFQQALEDKWFVLIAAIILGGVSLILLLKQRKKSQEAMKTAEETMMMERAQRLDCASRQELRIPENAADMDIIWVTYQIKKGREKILENENFSIYAYCQDNSLCLADNGEVFKIPLSSIQKVVWVKKRLLLPEWNKHEPYNSKTYKPYHIRKNDAEQYIIRGYYSLRISETRGEFEVMVPEYDEKILFSLLPVQIQKEGF
ncbi:MAG TPA: hypothetical protein IAA80_07165 [Candidatus Gallacutalibacter pullistercoris]|nr:hypothetical protein [Candidatus Gallacutalibacter pullistercoris]